MKILKIYKETIADGPGIRYSIYIAGCKHACLGCHNLISWSFNKGRDFDDEYAQQIINDIRQNKLLNGVTFSGGDPMFSAIELLPFIKRIRTEIGINIWLYTGFTIEQLIKQRNDSPECNARFEILKYIDTLVDGRFEKELYDANLLYRGSSNQKIIDTKKYLLEIKLF